MVSKKKRVANRKAAQQAEKDTQTPITQMAKVKSSNESSHETYLLYWTWHHRNMLRLRETGLAPRDAVFANEYLLELAFSELDTEGLWAAEKVCTSWRQVIRNSPALGLYKASATSMIKRSDLTLAKGDTPLLALQPFLSMTDEGTDDTGYMSLRLHDLPYFLQKAKFYARNRRVSVKFEKISEDADQTTSRHWRDIQVFRPAVQALRLDSMRAQASRWDRKSSSDQTLQPRPGTVIFNEHGVTLGDLADSMRAFIKDQFGEYVKTFLWPTLNFGVIHHNVLVKAFSAVAGRKWEKEEYRECIAFTGFEFYWDIL